MKKAGMIELEMMPKYRVTNAFIRQKDPRRRRALSRCLKEVRVWSSTLPGGRAFLAKETVGINMRLEHCWVPREPRVRVWEQGKHRDGWMASLT